MIYDNPFCDDRPRLGHPADLILAVVSFAVLAALCAIGQGCEDHGHNAPADATELQTSITEAPGGVPAAAGAPSSATTTTTAAADPLPPGAVRWCYGGFDGSRAAHDARCRIAALRVSNPSGLSLRWESEIPSDWAKDSSGLVVVALFFQAGDGSWKGGKFDWIDRRRSTRDLKNPAAGYGGWNWAEYLAARKHALVVVSADGRRRSNWIFD